MGIKVAKESRAMLESTKLSPNSNLKILVRLSDLTYQPRPLQKIVKLAHALIQKKKKSTSPENNPSDRNHVSWAQFC